ncbi:ATP synthase assembly factor Fmc1p, mitochondrial [[Candida] anglica]|uniref:ATP synthase assembly factor Fmc1p, mitochondrial n=1 Tax=[Candida] anglica TaxID=148631 RepID=A0ABP0EG19_9ASCO
MTSFKPLYEALQKELTTIHKKTFHVHAAKELERKKAVLQYKKIQLIKQRVPTTDLDKEIAEMNANSLEAPPLDTTTLRNLAEESTYTNEPLLKVKLQQLSNMSTFLRSQREYTELLERYNPGLTMDQEDKVRRTANRVGLSVPK